jgi:hypothetical protein
VQYHLGLISQGAPLRQAQAVKDGRRKSQMLWILGLKDKYIIWTSTVQKAQFLSFHFQSKK